MVQINEQNLKLDATKQRLDSSGKQIAEQILEGYLGEAPSNISDKLYPDWYKPEVEWYGHDGDQDYDPMNPSSFHSLTYQTNAHRQATRRRPKPEFMGYLLQKNCMFHTLDNPAKKVIAGASYDEEQAFLKAAMDAKETESFDNKGARSAVLSGPKDIKQVAAQLQANGNKFPQQIQDLTPSQRMAEFNWMRQGLQEAGFTPTGLDKEYTFYGHHLTPHASSRYNSFVDPFYASVSHGFSHYMLTSLPAFSGNKPLTRSLQFSYHLAKGSKPNYTSNLSNVKENIIFTDKMQIISPYHSDCFRPESIANIEPGEEDQKTSSGHFGIPLDVRKKFIEEDNLEDGLASCERGAHCLLH